MQNKLGDTAGRVDVANSLLVTHQRLAEAYFALHKIDVGIREARLVLPLKPNPADFMRAAIILGDLQAASGQAGEALATWRDAAQAWKTKDPQREQASLLRDRAELLERGAAGDCAAYRDALSLWEECARRGTPAAETAGKLKELRLKAAVSCAGSKRS